MSIWPDKKSIKAGAEQPGRPAKNKREAALRQRRANQAAYNQRTREAVAEYNARPLGGALHPSPTKKRRNIWSPIHKYT